MTTTNQPSLTASRWAVLAMFFINGAVFANWAVRIPEFQDRFNLSENQLGLVLLGASGGVLSALAIASALISRFSSRRMATMAGVALCAFFPVLALMPHPIALSGSLFILGGLMSIMDVAMNTQAAEVERQWGKPLMSSFHAAFSLGAAAGAGMGAGFTAVDIAPLTHFLIVGGMFLLVSLIASRGAVQIADEGSGGSHFTLPHRALWVLGVIALCSSLGEGSMADWGAVYMTNVALATPEVAALGFTAFSLAMTVMRLSGDWLTSRVPSVLIVRIGGTLAAIGLALAVAFPIVPVIIIGFTMVGIGLANIIPLVFSAAGNTPGVSPSKGIAGVATIGYAGFLAGPPVIGYIAKLILLRASLGLIALLVGSIVLFAQAIRAGRGDK